MADEIERADFVLVVCTEIYERRATGKEVSGSGLGASWEGAIIMQNLYRREGAAFVPVVVSSPDLEHVPVWLEGKTYYDLGSSEGYERLYRRLTEQPEIIAAPLGTMRPMPAVEPKWESDTAERPIPQLPETGPEPAGHGETGLGVAATGDSPAAWSEGSPTAPPAPSVTQPPGAPPLAQVLPGSWAVQIGSQLAVVWQGNFALAPTGFFQGQLVGPQGSFGVDGMWQVAPPAQLHLQGRQGTQFWVNPFQMIVSFAQILPAQLTGTTHLGEQTMWTRTG
jgi:hypothetical protein